MGDPELPGVISVTRTFTCGFSRIKSVWVAADTECMIISDEQAFLAAQALRSRCSEGRCNRPEISAELFAEVRAAIENTPETRDERVREAKDHLHAGVPDSREVAQKMISRIISDSLR